MDARLVEMHESRKETLEIVAEREVPCLNLPN